MRSSVCKACLSVRPRLGFELRDGHRLEADVGAALGAVRKRVLEPVSVVALRKIFTEVAAAALLASERAGDGGLGAVEQVADLACLEQLGVEDTAGVAHRDVRIAAAQLAELVRHLGQRLLGPE